MGVLHNQRLALVEERNQEAGELLQLDVKTCNGELWEETEVCVTLEPTPILGTDFWEKSMKTRLMQLAGNQHM